MRVSITCQCGQELSAPESWAGKKVACPACKTPLLLPSPEADLASLDDLGVNEPSLLDEPSALGSPPAPISFSAPAANKAAASNAGADESGGLGKWVMISAVIGGLAMLSLIGFVVISSMMGDDDDKTLADAQSPSAVEKDIPEDDAASPVATSDNPAPKPKPPADDPPDEPAPVETPSQGDSGESTDPTPPPDTKPSLASGLERWHTNPSGALRGTTSIKDDDDYVLSRYSWMCQLLPHLGYQEMFDKFDFKQPWRRSPNAEQAITVIPEFQNPADDRKTWKGYPYKGMALSHFVGMSGIEDQRNVVAAKLPRSDPRAGVFGYGEVARREEITDGTSQTIISLGSGELAGPWIQGGGSTIRGAREPYFDSITGFGSRGGSRRGVIVVFADGSTHHIADDINPAIFRALCTIHGSDPVDLSELSTSLTEAP